MFARSEPLRFHDAVDLAEELPRHAERGGDQRKRLTDRDDVRREEQILLRIDDGPRELAEQVLETLALLETERWIVVPHGERGERFGVAASAEFFMGVCPRRREGGR